MKIQPLKTNDITVKGASKVLVYAHHGAGKTTQAAHYADRYGKGLIISGESGLTAIANKEIDYLKFTTFDSDAGEHSHSFKDIVKYTKTPEFREQKYAWIMIDSATELSQRCMADVETEVGDSKNGFEKWGLYERKITAALKWIRDLEMHVVITALAAEETDDNGVVNFWPMLVQKKVQKLIPALYDHVFCLVRKTTENNGKIDVRRYIITEQVHGWHGKSRDPYRRLSATENTDDVTELLERIYMTQEQYNDFLKKGTKE